MKQLMKWASLLLVSAALGFGNPVLAQDNDNDNDRTESRDRNDNDNDDRNSNGGSNRDDDEREARNDDDDDNGNLGWIGLLGLGGLAGLMRKPAKNVVHRTTTDTPGYRTGGMGDTGGFRSKDPTG